MSNFVNKIKKGETEYDIQDVRLPDASAADAGKVLAVNDQGELVLQQASSGGTKLYKHEMMPEGDGYVFSVITTKSEPYTYNDFESLTHPSDAQNLRKSWIAVSSMFVTLGWNWENNRVKMIRSSVSEDGTLSSYVIEFSSFSQTRFTDTVTEL